MRKKLIGYFLLALIFVTGSSIVVKSAIQQISGLAVAQTSTKWNSLKDAAVGDALTSGVAAMGMYMYDSSLLQMDRVRGDTTNGLYTQVKSFAGGVTPIDNYTTPTDAIDTHSLLAYYDGSTWDMARGDATNGLLVNLGSNNDTTPVPYNTSLLTLLNAVTGVTTGTSNNLSYLLSKHTWTIVVTGAPTSMTVNLQGSIDNSTWYTIDTSTTLTSEMRHVVNKPILYVRADLTDLAGGTTPTVTIKQMSGGN